MGEHTARQTERERDKTQEPARGEETGVEMKIDAGGTGINTGDDRADTIAEREHSAWCGMYGHSD